jgi:hypothetical protein
MVRGAKPEDGLPVTDLERALPEEVKPRHVETGKGYDPTRVKSKPAEPGYR